MIRGFMFRGFTLIEMLIAMTVMIILFTVAIPSFSQLTEKAKTQRLAEALQGVFNQARSEAVLSDQVLYLHFSSQQSSDGQTWQIIVNSVATAPTNQERLNPDLSQQQALISLDSESFNTIQVHSTEYIIPFDAINGKPQVNGNLTFYIYPEKQLKLKYFRITGRVVLCSEGGTFYGYQTCSN